MTIGPALMRAGAKIAGPAAARSQSAKILRPGGAEELGSGLGGGGGGSDNKIMKVLQKVYKVLADASPMFKQTALILQKSFLVALRPLGDFIGKFMRPVAIWTLKLSVMWYKWLSAALGVGGGENATGTGKEDLLKQAQAEKTGAEMRGDTAGVAAADKKINDIKASMDPLTTTMAAMGDQASTLGSQFQEAYDGLSILGAAGDVLAETSNNFWNDILPASVLELWDSMKGAATAFWEALQSLWDVLKPILEPLWELVKVLGGAALFAIVIVLTGAFKLLEFVFLGLKTVLDLLMVGWIYLWTWLKEFGAWIGTVFVAAWDTLKTFFTITVPGWFQSLVDAFKAVWDSISGLWSKAKDGAAKIWDKLKNPGKGDTIDGEYAVGGPVRETGNYRLHAGERIMTAGDSSRARTQGGKGFSSNNYINITANLSNDMDIKSLARKLAEYQEVELRRRVSY